MGIPKMTGAQILHKAEHSFQLVEESLVKIPFRLTEKILYNGIQALNNGMKIAYEMDFEKTV